MTIIDPFEYETSFLVMPKHLNYMGIIFGGDYMAEIDKACAVCVNEAVQRSRTCDKAVTFKFYTEFAGPSHEGDVIYIKTKIEEVRKKTIKVSFKGYSQPREKLWKVKELTSAGWAVFVTMHENHYINHELKLKEK